MDTSMTADEMVRQITAIPDQLGASACFGTPVERGGHTVIPAARVTFGYGFGFGRGSGPQSQRSVDGHVGEGEGEGGGGGGGGGSAPVAVIHITDNGVEIEPIVDSTRVSLAGITLSAWAIFWILWTIRTLARERAKARRHEVEHASA